MEDPLARTTIRCHPRATHTRRECVTLHRPPCRITGGKRQVSARPLAPDESGPSQPTRSDHVGDLTAHAAVSSIECTEALPEQNRTPPKSRPTRASTLKRQEVRTAQPRRVSARYKEDKWHAAPSTTLSYGRTTPKRSSPSTQATTNDRPARHERQTGHKPPITEPEEDKTAGPRNTGSRTRKSKDPDNQH